MIKNAVFTEIQLTFNRHLLSFFLI